MPFISRKSTWIGIFAVLLGAIVIVLIPEIQKYLRAKKDLNDLQTICSNVLHLMCAKSEFAFTEHRIANDVSVSWNDIEPFLNSHNMPPDLTNIAQFNVCGEKYILNGRLGCVEAELPRPMCGFARGTRISDEYADILDILWRIERSKASGNINVQGYDNGLATFSINPPGVSPTARLKESIPAFPAGTEISLPIGAYGPWWRW
ncbi:MAG: hypothetical protein ABSG59_23570 [Verrucomicrobiota bacterium]|jgi:hypothetical protein